MPAPKRILLSALHVGTLRLTVCVHRVEERPDKLIAQVVTVCRVCAQPRKGRRQLRPREGAALHAERSSVRQDVCIYVC